MLARMILLVLIAACAVAGPSPARAQIATYHCQDGGDFVASFFPGGRRVSVKVDGRNVQLTRRLALSGRRYVSGDIVIRFTGQTARLARGRRSTDCTAD